MTIWVLGDSFAKPCLKTPWAWYNCISSELGSNLVNLAFNGSGTEYTYTRFEDKRLLMSDGDIVITCLTALHRRYFFHDRPGFSRSWMVARNPKNLGELDAFKAYDEYLSNPMNYDINAINWLYHLAGETASRNMRSLVMACFEPESKFLLKMTDRFPTIEFALGFLMNASENEFGDGMGNAMLRFYRTLEPRTNHLCRMNHEILSKKILDWIKQGIDVDLTSGFHGQVITPTSLADLEFRSCQFSPLDDPHDGIPSYV